MTLIGYVICLIGNFTLIFVTIGYWPLLTKQVAKGLSGFKLVKHMLTWLKEPKHSFLVDLQAYLHCKSK